MRNLEPEQKKEIIQKNLDSIGVLSSSFMSGSFFVKVSDEKTFEKDFMKNLSKSMNTYLEDKNLNPQSHNRGLTYSMQNKGNDFTIHF
jgi:hypothetical protein